MKSRRLRSTKLLVKHKVWYEPKALNLLLIRLFFIYIVMPFFHFSRSVCSVGKDILFCNFGLCMGWCELQMCMAFSVGLHWFYHFFNKFNFLFTQFIFFVKLLVNFWNSFRPINVWICRKILNWNVFPDFFLIVLRYF